MTNLSRAISRVMVAFVLLTLLVSTSGSAFADRVSQSAALMPGPKARLVASGKSEPARVISEQAYSAQGIEGASFNITYVGPWTQAARTAFQHAANVWAAQLQLRTPVEVVAEWTSLGSGVLVEGGPTYVLANFNGAPLADTWYAVAAANHFAGTDLAPEGPDIQIAINSDFAWYTGTDGNCPYYSFDLVTSGLAGLTFGMGFLTSNSVSVGVGSWGWGTGDPFVFDRFVENGSGQKLTNVSLFPNPSVALANQLTSNNLFFGGQNARDENGGIKPKLYAPSTWQPGLSVAHLDENTYPAGNPNSLMTPFLGYGEAIHDPGPIMRGIFRDTGLPTGSVAPSPTLDADLQLQILDSLPTNIAVRPYIGITNLNPAPATYTVVVELRQGFGLLQRQTQDVVFAWSGWQNVVFNFGTRSAGNYYIRAELWHNDELMDSESRSFVIGIDLLQLDRAAGSLTDAAYDELEDGEGMAVEVLSKAATTASGETLDLIVDQVIGKVATGFTGIAEIAPGEVTYAVEQLLGEIVNFRRVVEKGAYEWVSAEWRRTLDGRTYDGKRGDLQAASIALLDFAASKTFTWQSAWQAEVARREAEIENQNETASGLSAVLDFNPPFVHRASLVQMKGQFDWIRDTLLPALETVSKVLLIGLVVVLLIIGVILLVPSASVPPLLLAAIVVVAKGVAVLLPVLLKLLLSSQTSKYLIATIVLLFSSIAIGGTAEGLVAPKIVTLHQEAMGYLEGQIGTKLREVDLSAAELSVRTQGHTADLDARFAQSQAPSKFEWQLFRGDGQLMDIAELDLTSETGEVKTIAALPAGPYWAVGVVQTESGWQAQRMDFEIDSPNVLLELQLVDSQLSLGETLAATVKLTNRDTAMGTGRLVLGVKTVDGEGLQVWLPELGSGESASYSYSFKPETAGGNTLSAVVSDELDAIARVDQAFVVGAAPAVALVFSPQVSYAPGQTVTWAVTATNAGTQSASTSVATTTYDRNDGYAAVHSATKNLSIAPGSSVTFDMTVLPSATAGAYSTHVALGGKQYRTVEYLVRSQGSLFVMTEANPLATSVSTPVALTVEVQDETYSRTDCSVAATLQTPDGVTITLGMVHLSTGRYQATYTPTVSGTYVMRASASKQNFDGDESSTFFVVDTPSTLLIEIDGALMYGVAKQITVNVRNERQLPVSDARVVLSGEHGLSTARTDESGVVHLTVQPTGTKPVTLDVEKPGFAGASLEMSVGLRGYLPLILVNR